MKFESKYDGFQENAFENVVCMQNVDHFVSASVC